MTGLRQLRRERLHLSFQKQIFFNQLLQLELSVPVHRPQRHRAGQLLFAIDDPLAQFLRLVIGRAQLQEMFVMINRAREIFR